MPTSAGAETIAIKGGRVYVEPNKVIDRATLVIRNGVVRSVGKNVAVPSGARVIDASGKIVTAGFIESSTALGLLEVSLESSTREGSFGDSSQPIHAAYRVSDGYNATSVAIPVARAQGVTSAVAVPRGGLVSGTSGWFSLADAMTPDVTVKAPLAMYASLGEASLGSAQGSRGMAILRLRELLDDARTYSRQKPNYQRNQSRPFAAARLDLEALIPVVQGRLPLVVRAHRSSDILAALRLAGEFGLRVAIEGGTEAWMVAKELARARIGVILNPAANLPQRFERTRVRDDAAKLLAEAGVAVAISSIRGPMDVATIRQLAGIAVANGMAYEHALAAVTSVPAALFGVDRGTIGPGKAADIVIWSGDPFELSTRAEHVIIAGRVTSTRNRQTLLLERYRTLAR
ncbi:MAG: amidohydrolase family protein [Proteobacteria bacterium]|nr:amidohydrolase family protein [Pseudomonadota bacterium]